VRTWFALCAGLAALLALTAARRARGAGAIASLSPLPSGARPMAWAARTVSPSPLDGAALDALDADPLSREALARCGAGESGLRDAARAAVAGKLRGDAAPDLDAISSAQRAAGEPHPWPRVWLASAVGALDLPAALRKLDAWLSESPTSARASRRCGAATGVDAKGVHVLAVVAVDAVADLAAIPIRARTGQWLSVEARLHVPATGGRVLALGPGGAPRTLPTSFDGVSLRALFAADRPGEHTIQVVADVAGGPRPVLEATVFADVDPPAFAAARAAPGEEAAAIDSGANPNADAGADADALARMLTGARAAEGLPALTRDPRLDAVAQAHAQLLARAHRLAHDAGDGAPPERLRDAGLDPRDAAENVAHATSPALAHRAQWWSPSHRANMLRPASSRFGAGATRDERGDVWVVEEFARLAPMTAGESR
jgi:uncharacterized protein YkwD